MIHQIAPKFYITIILLSLYRCMEEKNWDLLYILKKEADISLTNEFTLLLKSSTDYSKMFLSAKTLFPNNMLPTNFIIILKIKFLNQIKSPGTIFSVTDPNSTKRLSLTINTSPGIIDKVILHITFHPIDEESIIRDVLLPFEKNTIWTFALSIMDDKIMFYTSCDDIRRPFGYEFIETNPTKSDRLLFKDGAVLSVFNEGDGTNKLKGEVFELAFANYKGKLQILCTKLNIEGSGSTRTMRDHEKMGNVILFTEKIPEQPDNDDDIEKLFVEETRTPTYHSTDNSIKCITSITNPESSKRNNGHGNTEAVTKRFENLRFKRTTEVTDKIKIVGVTVEPINENTNKNSPNFDSKGSTSSIRILTPDSTQNSFVESTSTGSTATPMDNDRKITTHSSLTTLTYESSSHGIIKSRSEIMTEELQNSNETNEAVTTDEFEVMPETTVTEIDTSLNTTHPTKDLIHLTESPKIISTHPATTKSVNEDRTSTTFLYDRTSMSAKTDDTPSTKGHTTSMKPFGTTTMEKDLFLEIDESDWIEDALTNDIANKTPAEKLSSTTTNPSTTSSTNQKGNLVAVNGTTATVGVDVNTAEIVRTDTIVTEEKVTTISKKEDVIKAGTANVNATTDIKLDDNITSITTKQFWNRNVASILKNDNDDEEGDLKLPNFSDDIVTTTFIPDEDFDATESHSKLINETAYSTTTKSTISRNDSVTNALTNQAIGDKSISNVTSELHTFVTSANNVTVDEKASTRHFQPTGYHDNRLNKYSFNNVTFTRSKGISAPYSETESRPTSTALKYTLEREEYGTETTENSEAYISREIHTTTSTTTIVTTSIADDNINNVSDNKKVRQDIDFQICLSYMIKNLDICKETNETLLTSPKGSMGEKGDIGPRGQNGKCDHTLCQSNIYKTNNKGEKGVKGECNVNMCNNIRGEKGVKGKKGSSGMKGEKGTAEDIDINLVKPFLDKILSNEIDNIMRSSKGVKGEPCECKFDNQKFGNGISRQELNLEENINIGYGSLIFENRESMEKVAFHLPIGSMVHLLNTNIFLVKIDHSNNIWRSILMESHSKDWILPSLRPIPRMEPSINPYEKKWQKMLHLIALPMPTMGDLKSTIYHPGGYSGAAFQCQQTGEIYGYGRNMLPLINSEISTIKYIIHRKYKNIPIYNSRGERLSNNFSSLISMTDELQNEILDFDRKPISDNIIASCVWIGEDQIRQQNSPIKCQNWKSRDSLSETLVSMLIPLKPMLSEDSLKHRSCSLLCHILCIQTKYHEQ